MASILKKEKNDVTFTFTVGPEVLEEGVVYAFNKSKSAFSIPGFRKGKVPRKFIEAKYGPGIFYEEASQYIFNSRYDDMIDELNLDTVSKPSVEVKEIDPEKGIVYEITVTVKPEVTLGQYKGIKVSKVDVSASDEEVMEEIKKVQNQNARMAEVTNRPATWGDKVMISYKGFIDGVPFPGGQSSNHELEIGSRTFVYGFEEQVVDHSIGEDFTLNVRFPEDYPFEEVRSKDAVFEVKIKSITGKELPELNDEFAQDVSEFDTLDEYKASIRDNIITQKEIKVRTEKRSKIMESVVANAQVDVPQVMIDEKADQLYEELINNLKNQGIPLDIYYNYTKFTEETLRENFKESAGKNVRGRLVLEAVAAAEGFVITQEDYEKKCESMAKIYQLEVEKIKEVLGEDGRRSIETDMLVDKAFDFIEESAIEE